MLSRAAIGLQTRIRLTHRTPVPPAIGSQAAEERFRSASGSGGGDREAGACVPSHPSNRATPLHSTPESAACERGAAGSTAAPTGDARRSGVPREAGRTGRGRIATSEKSVDDPRRGDCREDRRSERPSLPEPHGN